jgi:hypothetical protein
MKAKTPSYSRGRTPKDPNPSAARPPKLKGRVANDLWAPPARSAAGPPPQRDTQEPRGKGLTRGRKR